MSFQPQVRLVPATVPLVNALHEDRDVFGDLLGSPVPDGWPEFPEAIGFTLDHLRNASEADRAKATQLATIPGISRVENQLIVDLSAPTGTAGVKAKAREGAEKTKEGAEKVGEKTKSGAEKVADKTKEGLSKTGEVITDGWITTRVKSKFVGEDLLKDSDINVDTNDHVVTLRGTVMSAAGRARAIAQAKEVEGVHKVVDQLTIGPKK